MVVLSRIGRKDACHCASAKFISNLTSGVQLLLQYLQVDALTTKRGKEGGWVVERLLNQV